MKFRIIIMAFFVLMSLFSCSAESSSDESSISVSSTDESNENSSAVNSTVENNESSEPVQETWIETETSGNENITTEYRNFGNDWTRTVEVYDSNGVMCEKIIYEIINREIVKSDNTTYDSEGDLIWRNIEIPREDGTTESYTESVFEDQGRKIRLIDEDVTLDNIDNGEEVSILTEKVRYEDADDGTVLALIDSHRDEVDGKECMVDEGSYYKDGEVHHYMTKYISLKNVTFERIIYDSEMNLLYREIIEDSESYTEQILYREEGYIKVITSDNLRTYYESFDSATENWILKIEIDPETGVQINGYYNSDVCDDVYANAFIAEAQTLNNNLNEFINDIDYIPGAYLY